MRSRSSGFVFLHAQFILTVLAGRLLPVTTAPSVNASSSVYKLKSAKFKPSTPSDVIK